MWDTLVRLAGTGCSCFLDAIQALLPPEFAPVLAGLSQWRTGSPFDFDTPHRILPGAWGGAVRQIPGLSLGGTAA